MYRRKHRDNYSGAWTVEYTVLFKLTHSCTVLTSACTASHKWEVSIFMKPHNTYQIRFDWRIMTWLWMLFTSHNSCKVSRGSALKRLSSFVWPSFRVWYTTNVYNFSSNGVIFLRQFLMVAMEMQALYRLSCEITSICNLNTSAAELGSLTERRG